MTIQELSELIMHTDVESRKQEVQGDVGADTRAAVRRLLMYWGNVERAVTEKRERIAEIDEEIERKYNVKSSLEAKMPGGNGPSNPTQNTLFRKHSLMAAKEALQSEINEMQYRAKLIEEEVMCLPQLESEVIRLRYVRFGMSRKGYWLKIANRVHVSEDHAKKLERKGVDALAKRIKVDTIGHD